MMQEDHKLLKMNKEEYDKLQKSNEQTKALLSGISSMSPKVDDNYNPYDHMTSHMHGRS